MPTYECPICHTRLDVAKPEEAPYRPFCSQRCKLIDLGHWLNEDYRIVEEVPEPTDIEDGPEDEKLD